MTLSVRLMPQVNLKDCGYAFRQAGPGGKMHLSPSKHVIKQFGSVTALAKVVGVHRTTVTKWNLSRSTGKGVIPVRHHLRILKAAKIRSLDIKPEDLVLGRKTK